VKTEYEQCCYLSNESITSNDDNTAVLAESRTAQSFDSCMTVTHRNTKNSLMASASTVQQIKDNARESHVLESSATRGMLVNGKLKDYFATGGTVPQNSTLPVVKTLPLSQPPQIILCTTRHGSDGDPNKDAAVAWSRPPSTIICTVPGSDDAPNTKPEFVPAQSLQQMPQTSTALVMKYQPIAPRVGECSSVGGNLIPVHSVVVVPQSTNSGVKPKRQFTVGNEHGLNANDGNKTSENMHEQVLEILCDTNNVDLRFECSVKPEQLVTGGSEHSSNSNKQTSVGNENTEKMHEQEPVVPRFVTGVEKKFECSICAKKFDRQCKLQIHLDMHDGKIPFKCRFCDKKFTTGWNCRKHERIHTGDLPQCKVCGGRFVTLEKHMLVHSEVLEKLSCSVCGKDFTRERYLLRHMQLHSGNCYTCQECGKNFRTLQYLNKHILAVYVKEKNHVCSNCGKTFATKQCLNAHMYVHSDERPFYCETCGHSFKQKLTLNAHLTTHSSERRFTCDTCGKQFRRQGVLQRHELIHSGVQPYECSVCGMKFNQSCSVTRHMLTHTGKKPYSCDICGERFTQSGGLCSHRRKHFATDKTPRVN